MPRRAPNDAVQDAFGASEMARMIMDHDWAATPLGGIDTWPPELTQAVALILRSEFQLAIYWGPDLVLLYNDAERVPLGQMHPAALGQPARVALRDVWGQVGATLQGVLDTGTPTWSEDAPLVLCRGPAFEEAFFTWSYSPVLGPSGRPEGVLLVSKETTRHVLAERRLQTLSVLTERTAALHSVEQAWREGVDALVADPDIVAAAVYVAEGPTCRPVVIATNGDADRAASSFDVADIVSVTRLGRPILRTAPGDGREGNSVVLLPLSDGYPLAQTSVLAVTVLGVRLLDRGQRDYLYLAANAVATAASNATAYEHERERTERRATVQERRRIERDLHDSIQRQLLGARLVTEQAREVGTRDPIVVDQHLEEVSNHLGTAMAELREVIEGTYPSLLRTRGLAQAVGMAAQRANLAVTIDTADMGRLDESIERALYFATLEALQNVTKHGGAAAQVRIRFRQGHDGASVDVYDSGPGFDQSQVADGAGISNMRERMHAVGGRCRVRSVPSQGTWVHLSAPTTARTDPPAGAKNGILSQA